MRKCSRCYSYAINPGRHGRGRDNDLDLCDVCYWRKRAVAHCHMCGAEVGEPLCDGCLADRMTEPESRLIDSSVRMYKIWKQGSPDRKELDMVSEEFEMTMIDYLGQRRKR